MSLVATSSPQGNTEEAFSKPFLTLFGRVSRIEAALIEIQEFLVNNRNIGVLGERGLGNETMDDMRDAVLEITKNREHRIYRRYWWRCCQHDRSGWILDWFWADGK